MEIKNGNYLSKICGFFRVKKSVQTFQQRLTLCFFLFSSGKYSLSLNKLIIELFKHPSGKFYLN